MRRLLLILSAAALMLCMAGLPAVAQDDLEFGADENSADAGDSGNSPGAPLAQSADEISKEIAAYKKKHGMDDAAPPAAEESAKKPAAHKKPAAANPLGMAGNLPVSSKGPAVSQMLAMPSQGDLQAQMEADLAEQKRKLEAGYFESALKQLLPLSPEQIRIVLDKFKDSRQASEEPIATPTPKIAVETVSLDPSQAPLTIKTSVGRVTTMTVLDETGSPWPIQDVSWAGKFIITPPEEGGHVVRITPQSAHGVGNISIRLVDLITPVTFTLATGLEEVDYRFDARIPKRGPLAKTPLIEYGGLKTVTGTDESLVQILDGTPPGGSEKLKIEGVDGRTNVWRVLGRIYLRTPLTLLSPAWNSSVTSADGMNVYMLDDTPVILLSDAGRMVHAHIADSEATP